MIIFFDRDTLVHNHIITDLDMRDTNLFADRDDWVEVDPQHGHVPHLDVEVTRDSAGAIGARNRVTGQVLTVVRHLPKMAVSTVTRAKVGEVLRLTGVAKGARIYLGGALQGIMTDDDGVVEIVPTEPGPHRLRFVLEGFSDLGLDIEVVA